MGHGVTVRSRVIASCSGSEQNRRHVPAVTATVLFTEAFRPIASLMRSRPPPGLSIQRLWSETSWLVKNTVRSPAGIVVFVRRRTKPPMS
jgi:hypothetical protein